MHALLLPGGRVATVAGEPLADARWRTTGCTGDAPDALCFLTARIARERWYARSTRQIMDQEPAGIPVTLERALPRT